MKTNHLMHERLSRFFDSFKADALVLSNGGWEGASDPNFPYFTGIRPDSSLFVVRRSGKCIILCTSLNYDLVKEEFDFPVFKFERANFSRLLAKALDGVKTVGINKRSMRVSTYERLAKLKPKRKFLDASGSLSEARAVKDADELVKITKAVKLAREIIESADVRVGKTEEQLAHELQLAALEHTAEIAFSPIVLAGKNARVPHGIPGKRKIGMNEAVLIDFGVRVEGYCSDLSRCFFTGACRRERKIYGQLQEIEEELVDSAKAGAPISQFAKLASSLFKKYKLPTPPHAIGHGIGLEVHESPRLSPESRQKFKNGMAFALEPAHYASSFGLRYEDDFVVRNGLRRLG